MKRLAAALSLTLTIAALSGCASDPAQGYSLASIWPEDVTTVAVPIFRNESFTRDVEFELTDAVIKSIEARTPYRVTTQARADTILLGSVREVRLEQLSASRLTGLGEEVIVSVTIDFEWRELGSDRLRVARKSFTGNGLFVPSAPTGERIELGRFSAVQELANDLVDELQAAW